MKSYPLNHHQNHNVCTPGSGAAPAALTSNWLNAPPSGGAMCVYNHPHRLSYIHGNKSFLQHTLPCPIAMLLKNTATYCHKKDKSYRRNFHIGANPHWHTYVHTDYRRTTQHLEYASFHKCNEFGKQNSMPICEVVVDSFRMFHNVSFIIRRISDVVLC